MKLTPEELRRRKMERIKSLFKNLSLETEKYNKNAKNPFLENNFEYNPFKSIYEQTYIWVEKTAKER